MPLRLHLYDDNLASPTYQEDILPIVDGLVHTTRVHGGFHDMVFRLSTTLADFWEWYLNKRLYRLVLAEDSGKVIWEGRYEDPELGQGGTVIKCYGYWSNFTDRMLQSKTYSAKTAKEIIVDMRDTTGTAEQLSNDNAHIDDPAVDLTITYTDVQLWDAITNQQNGVANFTSSTNEPWYIAVWEDRKIHFKARDVSAITWQVELQDLTAVPRIRGPFRSLRNSVYSVYGSSRTSTTTDTESLTKYLTRDYAVRDLDGGNQATAENRRDKELEFRKDIHAEIPEILVGNVRDANGATQSICRVRAGDVIRINDLIPATVSPGVVRLDALNTFFIRETKCDHTNNQLRIVPDVPDLSLHKALAAAQLRIIQ
jgi:hypothetical protein